MKNQHYYNSRTKQIETLSDDENMSFTESETIAKSLYPVEMDENGSWISTSDADRQWCSEQDADNRRTSRPVMKAILRVANNNVIEADKIWEDGPTPEQNTAIAKLIFAEVGADVHNAYWGDDFYWYLEVNPQIIKNEDGEYCLVETSID